MRNRRNECIGIALNKKDEPLIIWPAYTVFEVIDKTVLEEYIMMWFSRKKVIDEGGLTWCKCCIKSGVIFYCVSLNGRFTTIDIAQVLVFIFG